MKTTRINSFFESFARFQIRHRIAGSSLSRLLLSMLYRLSISVSSRLKHFVSLISAFKPN